MSAGSWAGPNTAIAASLSFGVGPNVFIGSPAMAIAASIPSCWASMRLE